MLLDTHILLWAMYAEDSSKLPAAAAALLDNPEHEYFVSAATVWEIAIKHALQRGDFNYPPDEVVGLAQAAGCQLLPVTAADAIALTRLPPAAAVGASNSDPFDRMLIAQAMSGHLVLVTHDSEIPKYQKHLAQQCIIAV
ncbi:type II toxin-antitoxin system VapC family toxin [Cupriavidus sp. D39]|uniref:type II toxin-antitoxin system VapC family toxin n=1 Tax=Cupriavidus sp. D39 TaxID=2997877 RepID=UPI002271CD00|nr:type II toxin-antitoxin system VapC family toxin [Cupriavidus sp. D39]MCY0856869.1 type II toxin-antitoxin system VapC family toxin [Cupriavidus sp. D39]